MSKGKLRACPFCGGAAVVGFLTGDGELAPGANCSACGAMISTSDFDEDEFYKSIAEKWNTRPIEDAQAATIAELQRDNAALRAGLEGNERQREIDQNHFVLIEKHLNNELATLRADAITARMAAEMRVKIPGEFIEFDNQLWIPTAKHEAVLADKIEMIRKQAEIIKKFDAVGDAALRACDIADDKTETIRKQAARIERMREALESCRFYDEDGNPADYSEREKGILFVVNKIDAALRDDNA